MSWDRITEIDIDHRVPIEYRGAGGPPTLDEKTARLDYRNCQPLWASDNRSKCNKFIGRPGEEDYGPAPVAEPQPNGLTDDELTEVLAQFGL